ncbi:MAG: efflux RND transporter periplasmic adaptor subunit [Bryobacterales bacterium]|jgi:multidrug efflux pump subunit AcrA (membrane-fusion protein)|nr:efflux RND transporter periplasmic adaptor subunit [Bryobacterales bacterium]
MGNKTSLRFAAGAVLAVALSGCGGGEPASTRETPRRETVRAAVHVMSVRQATAFVEGTGTVEARTEAQIAARVMGYIQSIPVREGDRVSAGQMLVEISASEMQAAVAQARAAGQEARSALAEVESAIAAAESQAKLAEATFTRMDNLHQRKSISDQEFDEATARNAAAQAALRMAQAKRAQVNEKIQQASAAQQAAEAQLSYLRIQAPFAGLVTARMAEPGSLASPGMPLLRIEQAGVHRLVASFPESILSAVKLGQSLPVVIDAIGLRAEGTIAEIAPTVDAATRTVALKISLPVHASMRSGLFGKASVPAGTRDSLRVPHSAVRETGQLSSVFVLDGNVARSRMVSLGDAAEGTRAVLSGLSAGDRIVSNPPMSMRDGDPVEVAQ